jgi:hypothetical protein
VIAQADVEKVAEAARGLPPAAGAFMEEDYVMNLLETVTDYQLHATAVVRALRHFRDNRWEEIRTLEDLERLLEDFPDDREGNTALAECLWGYKLWLRAQELRGLVRYFREIGVVDRDSLRHWAHSSSFAPDFQGRVKGLGLAVYHALLMRQGIDTVKPDVHVRRFAESAVGRRLSDIDVVEVLVKAAESLGIKAYELDWRIWEASRRAA